MHCPDLAVEQSPDRRQPAPDLQARDRTVNERMQGHARRLDVLGPASCEEVGDGAAQADAGSGSMLERTWLSPCGHVP